MASGELTRGRRDGHETPPAGADVDVWHTRRQYDLGGGRLIEIDYVCVEPELADATERALGGSWDRSTLGPRAFLVRLNLLGDPPA